MIYRSRSCLSALLGAVVLGLVGVAGAKAPPPCGTLSSATTSIAVGIGVHWDPSILTPLEDEDNWHLPGHTATVLRPRTRQGQAG